MKRSITAGIDFGNQACVLSMPTRYGVDIVLNQSSNRKTPTIVGYDSERRFSGEFALQQQMMNINNTITHIKRLIGLEYNSIEREEISQIVPYTIVCLENSKLSGIQLENKSILRPEQILAFLLKSLLEIIQSRNSDITQIVLTVPPWWNEIQRRSILHTASISNLKIVSLLNSTTAAAISYVKIHTDRFSDDFEKKMNVIFIDIGDTSMNVAVTTLGKRMVDMKSFKTDKSISGHLFTEKLNEYLIQKVQEKYKIDPKTNKRSLVRFQQATEKVKKALSANPVMIFEVPCLMNDIDVSITVKREELNQLFENLSEKIECLLQKVIDESTFSKEDINAVEFLGGSSRMPCIKAIVKEFFGCDPSMSLDLDECFAIGAGYMAALEDGYNIGIDIINTIYPHEIRMKFEDKVEVIFKENSIMPSNRTFSVPIVENLLFEVFSNESLIGNASVKTDLKEKVIVNVVASIDKFGLFSIVDAFYLKKVTDDEGKEKEEKVTVNFSYSPYNLLPDKEIEKFAKIEEEMTAKDRIEIEIDNTKNKLESLIFSTENELNSLSIENDKDKDDIEKIKSNVSVIHSWFEENEFERLSLDLYKKKVSEIDEQINQFFQFKKYKQTVAFLENLKHDLAFSQIAVKKNEDKIGIESCTQFQTEISSQISEIDELLKLPKNVLLKADSASIQFKVNEIANKIEMKIKSEKEHDQIPPQNSNAEKANDQNIQKDENTSQQTQNETLDDVSKQNSTKKEEDQISSEKVTDQIKDNNQNSKPEPQNTQKDDNQNINQENPNGQKEENNQKLKQDTEKVPKNQSDQIPIQKLHHVPHKPPSRNSKKESEISPKPPQEPPSTNKKKINIVNINNDELSKPNTNTRNPALNPQKSRVKLPPMSPRPARNQPPNQRNRAARPILQNQKSAPSVVHPQSQKESARYAARQRGGGLAPPIQQKKRNGPNEGK